MISDDEIIDENGNQWNPYEYPNQDDWTFDQSWNHDHIWGVAVNYEGVAKVQSFGSTRKNPFDMLSSQDFCASPYNLGLEDNY